MATPHYVGADGNPPEYMRDDCHRPLRCSFLAYEKALKPLCIKGLSAFFTRGADGAIFKFDLPRSISLIAADVNAELAGMTGPFLLYLHAQYNI